MSTVFHALEPSFDLFERVLLYITHPSSPIVLLSFTVLDFLESSGKTLWLPHRSSHTMKRTTRVH